ncbi:MAG TPA: S-layer homology domain-containing protein, partial [Saprospiraceae bacterium]|nr:S-layer homology domain-containing protein [Saprospiraceae bacterium]
MKSTVKISLVTCLLILLFLNLKEPIAHSLGSQINTDTWTIHSPEGGIVWDVEVDSNNPSIIYTSTDNGGIFKSIDSGQSWSAINNGIDTTSIVSIAINPFNSSIVVASSTYKTYISRDGGTSWLTVLDKGAGNSDCIKFDPQNPEWIYLGGIGVFRSQDGGDTWSNISEGKIGDWQGAHIIHMAIDGEHPGTIYAIDAPNDNGVRSIWKTTNGGAIWAQLDLPGSAETILRSVEVDPENPNVIYAGTEYAQGSVDSGLYKSGDSGATWTEVITNPNNYFQIVFSKSNSDCVYVTSVGSLLVSQDGGNTWNSGSYADVMMVDADPFTPSILYGVGYHGVFKSMDTGGTWMPINSGLHAQVITDMAYDLQNNILFAPTWTGGLWSSQDEGETWHHIGEENPGYLSYIIMDPNNPLHLYMGFSSYIKESTDSGQTWTQRDFGEFWAINYASNSDLYMGDDHLKIFKSIDNGNNWVEKSNGLMDCPTISNFCAVNFITADPIDPNILYTDLMTTHQDPATGYVRNGYIYKTLDGGETWEKSDTGITNGYHVSLTIDPKDRSTLYLGTYLGLFKSTNGGTQWEAIGSELATFQINVIAVDSSNSQIIYAGTGGHGVYRSMDGGNTWMPFNNGMSNSYSYVYDFIIIPPNSGLKVPENSLHSLQMKYSRFYSIAGGQVLAYYSIPVLFTDVDSTYWAASYINSLYNSGITSGCGNGLY